MGALDMTKICLSLLLSGAILIAACNQANQHPTDIVAPARAVADNNIFIADRFGQIHALRTDGSEEWVLKFSDEMVRLANVPAATEYAFEVLTAMPDGKVYGLAFEETGSAVGQRILFRLDSGHIVWQQNVPYPSYGKASLVLSGDAVVIAAADGFLYSFRQADGAPLWKYRVSGSTLGQPEAGTDGTIYVGDSQNKIHAVGLDGNQKWAKSF